MSRLRQDGFEPWLDEEQLLPGHDWQHEIATAVAESDVVIVCLSKTSVTKSGYLQKELRRVLDVAEYKPEGAVFVIPVRLEDCPVPTRLRQWQYADLFASNGYERLRQALNTRHQDSLERPRAPDRPPEDSARRLGPPSATVRSKRWLIPALAFLVFLTSLIAWLNRPEKQNAAVATPEVKPANPEPTGMVHIAAASFMMGQRGADPDAGPPHEVQVAAYYLDRLPVTNSQYRAYLRAGNRASQSTATEETPDHDQWPVTRVSWDEASAFCVAQGKRLPTEAEWEFAARGTQGRLYPWGESFEALAVNSLEANVGHLEPVSHRGLNVSPLGVADMSGNAWQWCADDYKPYPRAKAAFAIPADAKVIRGGSFQSDRLHVTGVTRNLELPSKRSPVIGFRCAK